MPQQDLTHSSPKWSCSDFLWYLFAPGIPVAHLHLLTYLKRCMHLMVFCCKLDKCCPVNGSIATIAPDCAIDLALLDINHDDLEAFLGTVPAFMPLAKLFSSPLRLNLAAFQYRSSRCA
jgi:hypothetical protein